MNFRRRREGEGEAAPARLTLTDQSVGELIAFDRLRRPPRVTSSPREELDIREIPDRFLPESDEFRECRAQ